MKKTLGMVVALLVFLAGCIYIVFSSPVPTITHIKFEGDKSFIIGINNQDRVTIFHALNTDKTFNLQLFDKKSLSDASTLIKNRMQSDYVNVTVLSMNKKNNERLFKIIKEKLPNAVMKDAKVEDLVTYSDEVSYDLDSTYSKEEIEAISKEISEDIKKYVDEKIVNLKTDDIELLKEEIDKIDFKDYDLLKYDLSKYKLTIYPYSTYQIEFNYTEEFTYNIILNLELKEEKDHLTEIYKYTYNHSYEEISDYKTIFYEY